MIKAILFDVDGVLVDSGEADKKYKKELFKHAGYGDVSGIIAGSFHKPIRQVIQEVLQAKNISDKSEEERIFKLVFNPSIRNTQEVKFPKDLESVLKNLHKQFTLGIVTSRIRYGVDEIFNLVPIKEYFDVVISFDDVDNYKPHPEPLQKAVDKLGIKPEEAVYIGDSDTDIIAAAAIDMPSIHLSEFMHELAHHQIKDFSEVEDAIKLLIENHANDNT